MRLLIVSHTQHHIRNGKIVGWGPTVREIDELSTLFDETVHVAPLHRGPAPGSAIPYRSPRVRLRAVPRSGGDTLRDKLFVLATIPAYVKALMGELPAADVVHVRCPANISLATCGLLGVWHAGRQRWVKYAGNWRPGNAEAWSYRLQRWMLRKNIHRGVVTVNGRWPGQPGHIHSFLNPCLTDHELQRAREESEGKRLTLPIRLLYAGRVEEAKGILRALEILRRVRRAGISAQLDVVGEVLSGPGSRMRVSGSRCVAMDGCRGRRWSRSIARHTSFCYPQAPAKDGPKC
jgi:glycosyltransferase involved in cell wall biosynthesis